MFENAACDQCGVRRAITGVEQKEKLEDEEQRVLGHKMKDCVAAGMAEDWSQEKSCDEPPFVNDGTEKQEEEDRVASFPATLDNAVDHNGPSSDSASICHTDALNMETMNRLDELSREIENCWTWMKATYLDDEQWYRVYDETSLEDSLAPVDSDSVQRPDMLERNIIELVEEKHTRAVMEDDDNRDLHGNRVDHVNCSWASGFESETVDEEEECESIGGDESKSSTLADLPLLSMCSPESKHLSPVKGRLNIPARSPGTPEVETRKTRNDPAGETHRIQQAAAKQIWFRFEGKTRVIDIWETGLGNRRGNQREDENREKLGHLHDK